MDIFDIIADEKLRQENEICLIASENYVSEDVMKAVGSILTNKYAEGYPNKRYYGGCRHIDEIENEAIFRARQLFGCNYANVQPHSGSQANQAVYLALCYPGQTILGMSLDAGGHLTHGSKVSASGKLYNAITYGLDEDERIDFKEIAYLLETHEPRILIAGASAYPRRINFERFRRLVDAHNNNLKPKLRQLLIETMPQVTPGEFDEALNNLYEQKKCYLMVDMAHIAGLVAVGLHESPLPWADVVTSTTHKTLRGPRGGLILSNDEELGKKIDKAVFPGIQGGPLEHVIAGKAICFEEASRLDFGIYQGKVISNIESMVAVFKNRKVKMMTEGSDNHLILLDLRDRGISGKELEDALSRVGIVVNKNAVKDDPRPKRETSGVRLGTACITTRGASKHDAAWIANIICNVIDILTGDYDFDGQSKEQVLDRIARAVRAWCKENPIY